MNDVWCLPNNLLTRVRACPSNLEVGHVLVVSFFFFFFFFGVSLFWRGSFRFGVEIEKKRCQD
jgi:hypothetical protein